MGPSSVTNRRPSSLRRGAWAPEEDALLRKFMSQRGESGKWCLVPKMAGLNRCPKSCRLRWLNYLSPNINRERFGDDEVDLIVRLHKLLGNRWSLIAGRLQGRTANDIKNYWNTHLSRKQEAKDYSVESTAVVKVLRPKPHAIPLNWSWTKNAAESQEKSAVSVSVSVPATRPPSENHMTFVEDISNRPTFSSGIETGFPDEFQKKIGPRSLENLIDDALPGIGAPDGSEDFHFDLDFWRDFGSIL